jgi:hypothetical protein
MRGGEGWAALPSFTTQRTCGFDAVIRGADSERLTNVYLRSQGPWNAEVGFRQEALP